MTLQIFSQISISEILAQCSGSVLTFLREGSWFDPGRDPIFFLFYIVKWIFGISAGRS